MSYLKPFSGFRVSNPAFREHRPGSISFHYATDLSGTIVYRFNSYGFRGEEFDPKAHSRIFVAGESTGIGVGISEEQSWFGQFKTLYSVEHDLKPQQVNLLNFSQAGASTDYTCRVLLQQCEVTRPDLVVAVLSPMNRVEYFLDDNISNLPNQHVNILPFLGNSLAHANNNKTSVLTQQEKSALLQSVDAYYTFYTDRQGANNQINCILLLQNYLANRRIPYLIWVFDQHHHKSKETLTKNSVLSDLAEMVDEEKLLSIAYEGSSPRAADGIHVGPEAQKRISLQLMNAYRDNYGTHPC